MTAFYDIDTPVTLAKLAQGDHEYLAPRQIPGFDLYFSFTGGPTLKRLEQELRARRARALYCCVDPDHFAPPAVSRAGSPCWDLGYLGTYSDDRQPVLERLLLSTARRLPQHRFVVAGPQDPDSIPWPANVERLEHVAPADHPAFYRDQRVTLNITRAAMVAAGWSPSVRLFEAAAAGVPIVSDPWPGLDQIFAVPAELRVAETTDDVVALLTEADGAALAAQAAAARTRVLAAHTAAVRAATLEHALREVAVERVAFEP